MSGYLLGCIKGHGVLVSSFGCASGLVTPELMSEAYSSLKHAERRSEVQKKREDLEFIFTRERKDACEKVVFHKFMGIMKFITMKAILFYNIYAKQTSKCHFWSLARNKAGANILVPPPQNAGALG